NFPARSVSSARSPESTTMMSKPWLWRKELSRLRWPGSSSTIRMRGVSVWLASDAMRPSYPNRSGTFKPERTRVRRTRWKDISPCHLQPPALHTLQPKRMKSPASLAPASVCIRPATEADLAAINDIYNHYVVHSTCTYQEVPETLEGRRQWFQHHGKA